MGKQFSFWTTKGAGGKKGGLDEGFRGGVPFPPGGGQVEGGEGHGGKKWKGEGHTFKGGFGGKKEGGGTGRWHPPPIHPPGATFFFFFFFGTQKGKKKKRGGGKKNSAKKCFHPTQLVPECPEKGGGGKKKLSVFFKDKKKKKNLDGGVEPKGVGRGGFCFQREPNTQKKTTQQNKTSKPSI